jgi:transcriptional regulator GlxA family with amidase domain
MRLGDTTGRVHLCAEYEQVDLELQLAAAENRIASSRFPREVAAILDFIHGRLFEPSLNVNAIKIGCHLRNNNISTRFRIFVGIGIREYIERMRLEAARRVLECTDIDIYVVALVVGYEHQETFCRAFHRRFGLAPSRHRERTAKAE